MARGRRDTVRRPDILEDMSSAPPSAPGVVRPRDPHRLAEMRSMLLHRAVAERIEGDATIVPRASANLAKWRADGLLQSPHYDGWMRELSQGTASLVAFLRSDDERAREPRKVTPLTFVITPRHRWALWGEVWWSANAPSDACG